MPYTIETEIDKNAKLEHWLAGEPFDIFDDSTVNPNESSNTYYVFGRNDPLEQNRTDNSTVTLRALTAPAAMKFQQACRGYEPNDLQQALLIDPNDGKNYPLPFWINRRANDD